MRIYNKSNLIILMLLCVAWNLSPAGFAKDRSLAYKIGDKTFSFDQTYDENQGEFYKLEKQKYELIEVIAKEKYLDLYWEDLGAKSQITAEQARNDYLAKNATVDDIEIQKFIDRYRNHPKLKDLPDKEKWKRAADYLTAKKSDEAIDKVITDAIKSKKLTILYPKPEEPIYGLRVTDKDQVKYGPSTSDTTPTGCANDCPITVVEYSEYQCPFCVRVLSTSKQLLTEYRGKIRWIVRDFPLGFHNRARAAALAAKCAADQKKFWEMYETLFNNQRALSDADLKSYGKTVGLNQAIYESCLNNPQAHADQIEENFRSGERLGVNGTPAFFINGRKIDGAVPYEAFKEIFEEELTKNKR